MGTRADFYVGAGHEAEWLGSIAFDGYRIADMEEKHASKTEDNAACWAIQKATDEAAYRAGVSALLALNDDATLPEHGWPWPWNTSATTDYTYWFADGKCNHATFDKEIEWPDMRERQNITFGRRSGLLVITAK